MHSSKFANIYDKDVGMFALTSRGWVFNLQNWKVMESLVHSGYSTFPISLNFKVGGKMVRLVSYPSQIALEASKQFNVVIANILGAISQVFRA